MKDFFIGIYKRLIRPPVWLVVVNYILTFIYVGIDIALLVVNFTGSIYEIISYIIYALSAVHFAYAVYTSIKYTGAIYNAINNYLWKNKYTRVLLENYNIRTIVSSLFSFLMNSASGIFNGVLGILYGSIWYGALAAYHIIIALIRGKSVLAYRKGTLTDDGTLKWAISSRNSGISMLVLNVALSSAIAQMIFEDKFFSYPDWTVFAYATFAFYKITMAIINLVRARRQDSIIITTLRNINLIDASVSILALQTAILHTFSDGVVWVDLFNTLTGSAVSLVSLTLSILIIIKAQKIIRLEKMNGKSK